jgi:hypothetical protein
MVDPTEGETAFLETVRATSCGKMMAHGLICVRLMDRCGEKLSRIG